MKDLVAAAAMMAEGSPDQINKQKSNVDDDKRKGVAKKPIEAEAVPSSTATTSASSSDGDKPLKKKDISAARARRLEQNRRAAAESRRRKKVMIEELQRSVTFYTKANQNLLIDNTELEHRLYLAKRSLGMNVEGQQLKSPPEEPNQVAEVTTNAAMSTSYEQLINIDLQLHQQQKPGTSPTAGSIPFPHLHNSISPIEQLNQGTQVSQPKTSTALCGYNAFSQLTGTSNAVSNEAGTALNLADHLDTNVMPTFPLPSKEEVGSIKHIESLEKVCRFLFALLSYYTTTYHPLISCVV